MSDQDKLWTLIEDNPTCMFTTETPSGALRARPMHAIPEPARGEIWFYTRLDAGKSAEVADHAAVCLAFAQPKSNDYVSISGRATLSRDREMIDKHWSRFVDAWFPEGRDGPDVGMIRVTVDEGEYWDGESSSVLAAIKMLTASSRDETPDMGENRKIRL